MNKRKGSTRILVVSDLHCAHHEGIVPPKWQTNDRQKQMYNKYLSMLQKYKPFDLVIANGDATEGDGKLSGGRELVSPDPSVQVDMAHYALLESKCKTFYVIAGTPYHTGKTFDYERVLADKLGATFSDHLFLKVNGIQFSVKHKLSGGINQCASLAKEITLNRQRHAEGAEPLADVLIRSHLHRYSQVHWLGCLGFVTASLQGRSLYGSRECSGPAISWGILVIDVGEDGEIDWCEELDKDVMQAQTIEFGGKI